MLFRFELREDIRVYMSKNQDDDITSVEIEDRRDKLSRKINSWYTTYMCVLGQLEQDLKERYPRVEWPERLAADPEDEVLPIPSNLPPTFRDHAEFNQVLTAERSLREGRANDVLAGLKGRLGFTSYLWRQTSGQFGQAAKTRNGKAFKAAQADITGLRHSYNRTREKLLVLGEPKDSRNYPALTESDCRPLVLEDERKKPGHSKEEKSTRNKKMLSWLWRDGLYVTDMHAWQIEGTKLQLYFSVYILINSCIH